MFIGDEGVGYYQMSYPLYMFFVAMASGVPVAISKMISEKKAKGDYRRYICNSKRIYMPNDDTWNWYNHYIILFC